MSGGKRTITALPSELCVEVFARLPAVEDKLRLASVCRAFKKASKDPRAWKKCSIAPVSDTRQTQVGIIWTLSKHALHLEHLRCASKDIDMMLLLNTAWLYLPRLQRLGLCTSLDTLLQPRCKITVPGSLRMMDLALSHRSTKQASLDTLQSFSPVLTTLTVDATEFVSYGSHGYGYGHHHQQRQYPGLHFSSTDLPSLSSMRLKGPHIFSGHLVASCLTHISIENNAGILWKHFNECRKISNVQLASSSRVDFTGSEPLSLASVQFISLEAAIIEENGAFHGLEASRLQQLTLKIEALAGRPSRFKLDHLHADVGLMCKLEAANGYTIFSVCRRSCDRKSAQHD